MASKVLPERVNILGTEYGIEIHRISEDPDLKNYSRGAYCDTLSKLIVIADLSEKEYVDIYPEQEIDYQKELLRHEILHAFLNESGLWGNSCQPECGWAMNEEMIDWFSIQSPKIFKAYQEVGAL
jgi:hypothetical protein